MTTLGRLYGSPYSDLSFLGNLPGQITGGQGNTPGGYMGNVSDQAGSFASNTDPDLLARLAALKQYDPNASVTQLPDNGSGTFYGVSYDQSKLPSAPTSPDGQRWAVHPSDFANQFQSQMASGGGTDAIHHQVLDGSKNINSVYGDLTPGSNVQSTMVHTKPGLLDILGPMVPFAAMAAFPAMFGGLTAAGAASGAGELAASAGANVGSSALGNAATRFAMGVPGQLASGKFNPASLSGLGGAALGFPPWLTQLMTQTAQNKGRVNPVQAGMTLGRLSGLGGP